MREGYGVEEPDELVDGGRLTALPEKAVAEGLNIGWQSLNIDV